MKKLFLPSMALLALLSLPSSLVAQSSTAFGYLEIGCNHESNAWKDGGSTATLKREWTGCVSTFKATWNVSNGNIIPSVGRWLGKSQEYVSLTRVPANYTLSYTGSGSVSGANYVFGPYFGIKETPNGSRWIECYITTKSAFAPSRWDNGTFTYIGSTPGYKHYKRLATWDGTFWQLIAVKQSYSWSGPINVGEILSYWRTKTGLFNNNWFCKVFSVAIETKTDDGWFQVSNINFPQAAASGSTMAPLNKLVHFKGNNGKYVSSNNGSKAMTCDRSVVGSYEKFWVLDAGGGKVALVGNNDRFVSSENGAKDMICNRTTMYDFEKFTWVVRASNKVAFKGSNGRYVSSKNGASPMKCDSATIGATEEFGWAE